MAEWGDLETSRYVKADAIEILQPLSAQVGSFDVTVDGAALPGDAVLKLDVIDIEDYDLNVASYYNPMKMGALLGAYDISIMCGENEWQPAEGEKVEVSLNAASWGLYRGYPVYVIHVHENADGVKSYETIGPIKVKDGRIALEVSGFSNFYMLKGVESSSDGFALSNNGNDTYYVEPGATLRFKESPTWTLQENTAGNLISASGNTITVAGNAAIGLYAVYEVAWGSTNCGGGSSQTIRVVVATRQDVVEGAVETMPLGIYIRQPDEGTAEYPSEPGITGGTYFAVNQGATAQTYQIGGGTWFVTPAQGYLNPNIYRSPAWMYAPDGEAIGGIVDATGTYSLEAFVVNGQETINWENVALAIANYNDGKSINSSNNKPIQVRFIQEKYNSANQGTTMEVCTVILVNDASKTLASVRDSSGHVPNNAQIHYEEFKLIPYVIKLMDDGWHVDVAVIHEDSYLLGYDINLGEGYTIDQSLKLPSAQIVIDHMGNGRGVTVAPGAIDGLQTSDDGKPNVITVKNEAGERGVFQFQGWYTQNTASTSDTLIQPGVSISIYEDTTLYAIWKYIEGDFIVATGTLSIFKSVSLAPGSPFGAKIPTVTDGGYAEFEFKIDFDLATSHLDAISFDANKLDPATGASRTISGTLAGLINGTETYSFLSYTVKSSGGITLTIMLGGGESIHFLDVPIDAPSEDDDGDPDTYTVNETIPQSAKKYSAASAQEISATMSTTADAEFKFQNYYTPSVTGLEIIANGGDENEVHIYTLTSTTIDGFKAIRFAVPADDSVVIAGLLPGTYLVTEETAWNNLYSADQTSKTITLTESGNGEISFDYRTNGEKWLFGHSHEKKNAS